jgi:protein-tyrosine-phosphatase
MNATEPLKRIGARAALLRVAMLLCATCSAAAAPTEEVLFICEHGNVKSVMAAAYFNELAASRHLPLRAISRGASSHPASVPAQIVAALKDEGLDVSGVEPRTVRPQDAADARYIVFIGADLPPALQRTPVEQWKDVPAASADYPAASESLRVHVRKLLDRLSKPTPH